MDEEVYTKNVNTEFYYKINLRHNESLHKL